MTRQRRGTGPWHRLSLRNALLIVLLPGVLLVMRRRGGADLAHRGRCRERGLRPFAVRCDQGDGRQHLDRLAAAWASNCRTGCSSSSSSPPAARCIYRVATEDGLVEIGNADLPAPRAPLITGVPQFSDATYYGAAVRVGSYARVLNRAAGRRPGTAAGGHPGGRDPGLAPASSRARWCCRRWRATCCWCWRPRAAGAGGGRLGAAARWSACAPKWRRDRHATCADLGRAHSGRCAAAGRSHQPARGAQPTSWPRRSDASSTTPRTSCARR